MTVKLECIGHETINNLTAKKVVCPNVVQNVGTIGEQQNDQVSTQELPMFSRGEYSESNESLGVNEDDVAIFPNLKDLHRREALPIRHSSWHGKECNLLNLEGVFFTRGHVMVFDPSEAILDDILGDDYIGFIVMTFLVRECYGSLKKQEF